MKVKILRNTEAHVKSFQKSWTTCRWNAIYLSISTALNLGWVNNKTNNNSICWLVVYTDVSPLDLKKILYSSFTCCLCIWWQPSCLRWLHALQLHLAEAALPQFGFRGNSLSTSYRTFRKSNWCWRRKRNLANLVLNTLSGFKRVGFCVQQKERRYFLPHLCSFRSPLRRIMCLNWKRAHFDAFATFLNINWSPETPREIYRVYMERMFWSTFSKASVFTCLRRKGAFSKCSTFKTVDGSLRVHKQKRNQNYAISNYNASLV